MSVAHLQILFSTLRETQIRKEYQKGLKIFETCWGLNMARIDLPDFEKRPHAQKEDTEPWKPDLCKSGRPEPVHNSVSLET